MKIKPDIIVSWPKHTCYPLWQQFIRDNRDKFAKVIIVFTDMSIDTDYRTFVKRAMAPDNILAVMARKAGKDEDWRDIAVNKGLAYSDAEWVWFTEQDFFPLEGFDGAVDAAVHEGANVISIMTEGRMHPACIFAKRTQINKTTRNFGLIPDETDHFGIFQREIEVLPDTLGLEVDKQYYKHYAGLSQNMYLLQSGELPNYFEEDFKDYLRKCLKVGVPLEPEFVKMVELYLDFHE